MTPSTPASPSVEPPELSEQVVEWLRLLGLLARARPSRLDEEQRGLRRVVLVALLLEARRDELRAELRRTEQDIAATSAAGAEIVEAIRRRLASAPEPGSSEAPPSCSAVN